MDYTKSDEVLAAGKKAFERAQSFETDNRLTALDDIEFSRLSRQWPAEIIKQRELERRPCLTINKMPAFIRQVVNDARQNKPSIKVHPVDSGADVKTADVMNGLIRNIEYTSNADVAYDTAIEASVSGGFGYWRVVIDYAYDDTFDLDLKIERIANQFSVYGDPDSMCADSSDWNSAFVIDRMPKAEFKREYKGKKNSDATPVNVNFDSDAWSDVGEWLDDEFVIIGEWFTREPVDREIVQLQNPDGSLSVVSREQIEEDPDLQVLIEAGAVTELRSRVTKSFKVRQIKMTGADVLEVNELPGCYIPIIPVYGDEIVVEGRRYFRSLIHDAKDAQRMFNYWRTTSTELVALAPKTPFIGRKGTFDSDAGKWATSNTQSHAYLEYDTEAPIRQPLDVGPAAGALQEALNASDDMKAITGLYDASLGARSNETSGRAIMARQREGDVSTFHFIDNLSRAIRHTGRILIDLIPYVYTGERIIRVIGEDGSQREVKVNTKQPAPQTGPDGKPMVDDNGDVIMAIHNLTTGKYDLTVTSGPSFTTRREEAAMQMTEFVRAFPVAAPVIGDLLAKNLDWPGADEIAKRLEKMVPGNQQLPPEVQQMIEQGQQEIQRLTQENESLKADKSIDQQNADTNRMKVTGDQQIDRAKLQLDGLKAVAANVSRPEPNPTRQG